MQIIGESETEYLKTLSDAERRERFAQIVALPVPVFVLTKGLQHFDELVELCREQGIPILSSPALSSTIIKRISYFLEDHLVPVTHMHAVLISVYGIGVLLIGKSGIGKSESALDLVTRGHSLVADDTPRAGPSLEGLFGRRVGSYPGYRFSKALTESDLIWTEETVSQLFELGPEVLLPGTKMPLQRLPDPEARADLIAFLKARTDPETGNGSED